MQFVYLQLFSISFEKKNVEIYTVSKENCYNNGLLQSLSSLISKLKYSDVYSDF